jgi:hypothetical protein
MSVGAPRRRRFGDFLETTLGRFSAPVSADSMGQMDVFTGQMPMRGPVSMQGRMQSPMQRPVVGMKRGGLAGGDVEAPRRAVIKGQDHMLAYITPEEAGLLKSRGGWGGPGPRGIPSYPENAAAEGGFGLGAGEAFGGGVGTGEVGPGEVGGAFGGGGPGDFGGGGDGPGFDAFGDVYGSPAAAAVADAVAEAAATAANVGLGQSGLGGYGAQAAAETAAALGGLGGWGSGPSAQTSVSQPSMSVVDQLSTAMNPSAPTSMLDTFDPEVSFGMTAPSVSSQSVSSPSAPSVDVSPSAMSMSQSIASDMAQDMMGLSASQAANSAATQAAVDAAMDRGSIASGNFGPGLPGMGVTASDVASGRTSTVGVPGGTGSVSTNASRGGVSPAQASGIVSAIGDISRGTGSNVASNEAAAAQMATNQGITAEDVAMSQPVSVAPSLSPSISPAAVDIAQDMMALSNVTPSTAAATAPSSTVSPAASTQGRATQQSIDEAITSIRGTVNKSGSVVSISEQEIANIANKSGLSMTDVQSIVDREANKQGKSVSIDPNISSSVANLDQDTTPVSVAAPAAPSTTAPSISSGIDRGLAQAAAAQAIADTVENMGPLSGGQIASIASEFGLSPSEVSGLAGPSVSAQGVAPAAAPAAPSQDQAQVDAAIASGRQAVSSAPSMTSETDPNSAINQDRAQYNPQSLAQQQSTTTNDVISQVQTAMQNLDPEPNTAETIFGGILSGLTYGLITPDTLAKSRSDAAQAALDGYKSGQGMGDYGISDFGGDQVGAQDGCPEGYIRDPATGTCVPIGSTSAGADDVSGDATSTTTDGVGAINIPVRPVETFEDVLARITGGAPTIAPLDQPLRMRAGGAVGLNRAADSFLKSLAG